jgi:hypothetical protein
MTLAQYAKNKNMTYDEYQTLEANIKSIASATIQNVKQLHKTDTGVYYPIDEIIHYMADTDIKNFIILELKKLGVEFYDNNNLWRY